MSEHRSSDNIFSNNFFPIFLLVTGFVLLYAGHTELQGFLNGLSDYLIIRPDHDTIWLIILGSSMVFGGFIGLYRRYLYGSDQESIQ